MQLLKNKETCSKLSHTSLEIAGTLQNQTLEELSS